MPIAELKKLIRVGLTALTKSTRNIFAQNMTRALRRSGRLVVVAHRIKSALLNIDGVQRKFQQMMTKKVTGMAAKGGLLLMKVTVQQVSTRSIGDIVGNAHTLNKKEEKELVCSSTERRWDDYRKLQG